MRPDRDQRVVRKQFQLVPGHAEIAANSGFIYPVTGAQVCDLAMDILLAWQRAHQQVQTVEGSLLGGWRTGVDAARNLSDPWFDCAGVGDRPFERDPPQLARTLREVAGDVDGERCVKFPHYGKREIASVSIAIVKCEAGEAPREIALDQPLMHLVDGDQVNAAQANMRQNCTQKFRCDLEVTIGLEFRVMTWSDL